MLWLINTVRVSVEHVARNSIQLCMCTYFSCVSGESYQQLESPSALPDASHLRHPGNLPNPFLRPLNDCKKINVLLLLGLHFVSVEESVSVQRQ